jgi:hypothetical protein
MYSRLMFLLQPFEKSAELSEVDVVKPTGILFEFKAINFDCLRSEVVKVMRDENELRMLLKSIPGDFGLLPLEATVIEEFPS